MTRREWERVKGAATIAAVLAFTCAIWWTAILVVRWIVA